MLAAPRCVHFSHHPSSLIKSFLFLFDVYSWPIDPNTEIKLATPRIIHIEAYNTYYNIQIVFFSFSPTVLHALVCNTVEVYLVDI
jgi:hypothetical protein